MPQPVRLYSKATILGYKRSKANQYSHTSLIRIDGVNDKKDVDYYLGKRVAYVYRASLKNASKDKGGKKTNNVRCIWGKITRHHGNGGVVRAKFRTNLPPRSMGANCRVMLYPQHD